MSIKSFLTVSAVAVAALVAPAAQALFQGQATFQGVTFIFTQTDSNTLQFELKGTTPLGGDWATAQFFGAFDLKDLGITNFTAVANGPGALAGTIEMTGRTDAGVGGEVDGGSRDSLEARVRAGAGLARTRGGSSPPDRRRQARTRGRLARFPAHRERGRAAPARFDVRRFC